MNPLISSVFRLGGGGLKIQIDIRANSEGIASGVIVPLDHVPGWKIKKNPYSSLNHRTAHVRNHKTSNSLYDDNTSVVSDITSQTYANGYFGRKDSSECHIMYNGDISNAFGIKPEADILYAYDSDQNIEGNVTFFLPQGKRYEHLGIKIEFLGRITMKKVAFEGRPHYDFISLVKELRPPGFLSKNPTSIPFNFGNIEKQHETYHGCNISVKYLVRVLVERKFFSIFEKEREVIVQRRIKEPHSNEPLKMEVGIEECMHIELEYEKECYHLRDVILGNIKFLLVRIKIKYMELSLLRKETSGEISYWYKTKSSVLDKHLTDGSRKVLTETQTLARYEIMDGAPIEGETIPVRLYLIGIPANLTPTLKSINAKLSVCYFLNLVIVDEEDRRYFKQQEVILWRKDLG